MSYAAAGRTITAATATQATPLTKRVFIEILHTSFAAFPYVM